MQKKPEVFDLRNQQAKYLEFENMTNNDAKVGEFWRYYEGINIGNEISKDGGFKRPCLILQNNLGSGLFFVVPLTSKFHDWMNKYCVDIHYHHIYNLIPCRAICTQSKHIDKKRLVGKISEKKVNRLLVDLIIDKIFSFIKKSPIAKTG